MFNSLPAAAIALIIVSSWSEAAVRATTPLQGSVRAQSSELQQTVSRIANVTAKARAAADTAKKPQGRDALANLRGSLEELQQELEFVIGKAQRLLKDDTNTDVAALRQQLTALKKEKDSLMKLMAEKSDDARARTAMAQRVHNLANEIESTAKRMQATR